LSSKSANSTSARQRLAMLITVYAQCAPTPSLADSNSLNNSVATSPRRSSLILLFCQSTLVTAVRVMLSVVLALLVAACLPLPAVLDRGQSMECLGKVVVDPLTRCEIGCRNNAMTRSRLNLFSCNILVIYDNYAFTLYDRLHPQICDNH
jgi:hypothetical protein